jgi:hypothetical protein
MIGMPDLSNLDLNNILAQIGYVPKDGTPATTPIPERDIASAPTTDLYRGGIEIPAATSFNPSMPSVGGGTGGLELLTPSLNIQPPSQLYDIPTPQVMDINSPMVGGAPDYRRIQDMESFARGGEVHIDDGGFIMSARESAEIGKGSFPAAVEAVAPLGGIPLIGPGDGTSDSIPARIGGKQEARVASGEIYFPYDAVKSIGGGDHNKGTKKLYALMRKAEQSRKNTPRGEDGPNLLRGLA